MNSKVASEAEIVYRARMQGQNVSGVGEALRESLRKDSETKVRAGLIMAERSVRVVVRLRHTGRARGRLGGPSSDRTGRVRIERLTRRCCAARAPTGARSSRVAETRPMTDDRSSASETFDRDVIPEGAEPSLAAHIEMI